MPSPDANRLTPLPIDAQIPRIVESLRGNRSLVLVAPPGAGKTTRVPPAVLAAGLLSPEHPNLLVLQPRRVAARAVAMRIADENGWELGRQVGYHVRFDRKISRDTRLRVLTEGILTRQLLEDPLLEDVGGVILDEFHERNLNTDIAVALLREVQEARPDLLLIVMSATLHAEPVARYLGGCPIIHSEGRTFPVEITYSRPSADHLEQRIADAVQSIDDSDGDVLIFLPGAEEIRRSISALEPIAARRDADLLPLHGSLPVEQQVRAIRPGPRPKIICSTNIAETSLTIEGVTTVIDSGLARVAGYDADRGLDRLDLVRISKAAATQRAGRAGRVRPGRCIRLYTEKEYHALANFELPEIQRVDLAATVLSLHAWGRSDVRGFGWFDPPPEAMLVAAERLLAMLGALTSDTDGQITPLGRRILSLPVHPRLAAMLLAASDQGLAREGATLAALLSEKDILLPQRADRHAIGTHLQQSRSDLLLRMEQLEVAERDNFRIHLRDAGIDPAAARQAARIRDELLRLLPDRSSARQQPARFASSTGAEGVDDDALLRLPLLAYPDRVCRRRPAGAPTGVMVGGGGVRIADESSVKQGDFFLALDARRDARSIRSEALVRIASQIEEPWLEELFPHVVRNEETAIYDESAGRVIGVRRIFYRDLLLRESRTGDPAPDQAAGILRQALLPRAGELVAQDEALSALLQRIGFLRAAGIGGNDLPALDAESFVADACTGARSLADVQRNLRHAIDAQLTYAQRQFIDTHAPEAIEVPTGNRIRLDWSAAQTAPQLRGPVLAVRLQEMFGLPDTPRVAGGRVPVVLHLLGPNYRPVQVTTDLASFWKNTYPQVRKDLRARYPKHSWPDDPLTAPPQAKGGRRRS